MHVLKIRDELNEEFKEAGSPCYYECEYLDWHYVEEYDLIPSEEAIKFMREKQKQFREYIAVGGDPAKIKNIYDIKQKPCWDWRQVAPSFLAGYFLCL